MRDWMVDGGEMGKLIRSRDWSHTPLGPREVWPQSLRTTVNLILTNQTPMALFWGKQRTLLYCDAYRFILADRHPKALGSPVGDVWPEVWSPNLTVVEETVSQGEGVCFEDQPLPRNDGTQEDSFFTLCYNPLFSEENSVEGVLVMLLGTKSRVLGEQHLRRQLRQSEEQHRLFFENIRELSMIWRAERDAQGKIVDWVALDINREALEANGLVRLEVVGRRAKELFGEAIMPYFPIWERVLTTAVSERSESYFAFNDRYFLTSQFRLGPQTVASVGIDITDRMKAEKALRESEERFRALAKALPQLIWTVDAQGNLTYSNERFCEYSGQEPDTESGWRALIHPEDAPSVREVWAAAVESGVAYQQEFRLRRYDGEYRWFLGRAWPMRDATGTVVRWFGTSTDIDDLKRAAEALGTSEERFRSLVENAPDIIVRFDRALRHVYVNKEAERASGIPREESIGKVNAELGRPAALVDFWDSHIRAVFQQGKPETVEFQSHEETGERFFDTRLKPELDSVGNVLSVLAITRDITERKHAEEERIHLERKLLQIQKLESLGAMAGGIAHGFNNLLMGILGCADLELLETPSDAPVISCLRTIKENASRLSELTRQLLAYTGKEFFALDPVHLAQVVDETCSTFRATQAKPTELEWERPSELPIVEADASQVRQLVLNLLTNAAEAMENRPGRIRVGTGTLEASRGYLSGLHLGEGCPEGRYVFLEVADTGPGMDEATRRRLFEPFYTTKFVGRGLGLATVHGIVRAHRGAIEVQSELGKGSLIRVLFPLPEQQKRSETRRHKSGEGSAQKRTVVLVVDDDEIVRNLASRMLIRAGFEVESAADGVAAVEMMRGNCERIGLVLMDLVMPRMDGLQAMEEILAICPETKVLLSSGYDEQEALRGVVSKKPAGFLQKPYEFEKLQSTVQSVMSEDVYP